MRNAGLVAAGASLAPLSKLMTGCGYGGPGAPPGWGPLSPVLPTNTAALTNTVVGDLSGLALLQLPADFSYSVLSITGETMSDGSLVPGRPDGMAAYGGGPGLFVVVRNHELTPGMDVYGNTLGVQVPEALKYDPLATGGTTHLVVGSYNGNLASDYASLGGTVRNCAGGRTPWGTWISCEESVLTPATSGSVSKKHGYNFEVPVAGGPVLAEPLVAMGRFNHEATATDPTTGFVYQTEDRNDSAFYRYRSFNYADLAGGGILEALVITGQPAVDTSTGFLSMLNVPIDVEWVEITDVDPDGDTLRVEAHSKGAAFFSRGEGAWWGNGFVYFTCTNGGDAGQGQVWAYDPQAETLTLVVESTSAAELDHPDNITVGPVGRLFLCEDGSGEEFVHGVDDEGTLFRVIQNNFEQSEFAGVCFSSDERFMFVNTQGVGITYVIRGPWRTTRF